MERGETTRGVGVACLSRPVVSTATLVRMANQIAANFALMAPPDAATEVSGHLQAFWTAGMRADLASYVEGGGKKLDPVVIVALNLIAPTG